MQRLTKALRNYFGFSHREMRGFLLLASLLSLALAAPVLYEALLPTPVALQLTDQQKLNQLAAQLDELDTIRHERQSFAAEEGLLPSRLFYFNPNTLDAAGWQKLGLPKYIGERIVKYRSKGGQFRQKSDLRKIYGFPGTLYATLEPYIQLPSEAAPFSGNRYPDRYPEYPERKPYERPVGPVAFDLNTVDTITLQRLRGIGPSLARRIVKYRDGLGGFHRNEQVWEIYGIDSVAANEVLRYAQPILPESVQKIRINLATAEELDRHR